MKVLAINGSPRGARGNTERILQAFLEGAQEAGAKTEVVYLKDKQINHCLGCFNCWTKTPGVCVHKDDMPELLEKVVATDMIVYATPLYIFTVTGLMKDFMDRMIPVLQPFIDDRGGQYVHPPRYDTRWPKKTVLISNCGFPERHHFSGLEETFRRLTGTSHEGLTGVICCAGGELLRRPDMHDLVAWYLEAAHAAGRQVVEQGSISTETQAVLDRPLAEDPAVYARMANMTWESMGVERIGAARSGAALSAEDDKADTPLPPPATLESMRDLVAGMATSFNPEAADGLQTVIQFDVKDEEPGQYYLVIADGQCAAFEGTYPDPALTVHTPADVWMAISRGEMNGATAIMAGKYSIDGNLELLMRLDELFAAP